MMNFDIERIPFSRFGSYFAVSYLQGDSNGQAGVYLRTVHGDIPFPGILCHLELLHNGQPISYQIKTTPTLLILQSESGQVELCIPEPTLIRIRGKGVGLRLRSDTTWYDYVIAIGDHWQITYFSHRLKTMLSLLTGSLVVDAPWHIDRSQHISLELMPDDEAGIFDAVIEEFDVVWSPRQYTESFDDLGERLQNEYQTWQSGITTKQGLAGYLTWSGVVALYGNFKRPAMLMSKNWMTNVWSWDHCFNAVALARRNPELAWQQWMVIFDHQDRTGAIPDSVNDRTVRWDFRKPPIHGWALKHLLQNIAYFKDEQLQEAYDRLSGWTNFWFEYQDENQNGIPAYYHGNDSGWDNGTLFAPGVPVETPDLTAFLVLQMETLSDIASRLNLAEEATRWRERSDQLFQQFLNHFWYERQLVTRRANEVQTGTSLLLYLPILLGPRLPSHIITWLVEGIRHCIAPHGLATERLDSPLFDPRGYWRGSMWAPVTLLTIEGLRSVGEFELANEISQKFCMTVEKNGMSENYDPVTGEALCDQAYTWSASVYLILTEERE